MFTEEIYRVYDPSQLIICSCGRVCAFGELVPGEAQEVPHPSHVISRLRHYFCPNPKCKKALVYDRDDKSPLELVHGSSHLNYDI